MECGQACALLFIFHKSRPGQITPSSWIKPNILLVFKAKDGSDVFLTDYASAGLTGLSFQTWMEIEFPGAPPSAPFSRSNTTRTFFFGQSTVAPEAPASVAVKLLHTPDKTWRRVSLPLSETSGVASFTAALGARLGVGTSANPLRLLWRDNEGDWIVLERDEELREALRCSRDKLVLKMRE